MDPFEPTRRAVPVTTSLRIKGISELPMVGVAAAVANAVYHAGSRTAGTAR